MSNVRFMFLRDSSGVPVACVAFTLHPGGFIDFGLSTHNLDDGDKWDRKQARWIAAGKLLLEPQKCGIANGDWRLARVAVADVISTFSGFPTRAKKAAKNWLKANTGEVRIAQHTDDDTAPATIPSSKFGNPRNGSSVINNVMYVTK